VYFIPLLGSLTCSAPVTTFSLEDLGYFNINDDNNPDFDKVFKTQNQSILQALYSSFPKTPPIIDSNIIDNPKDNNNISFDSIKKWEKEEREREEKKRESERKWETSPNGGTPTIILPNTHRSIPLYLPPPLPP
jgi:hypothetical protein